MKGGLKNIACNLIYNNGDEGIFVGFNGRCDVKNILYNAKTGNGRWCSQKACSCKQFMDRGFKGKVEEFPCNESRLFNKWTWNPGAEYKTGEPFRILKSGKGKIAVLTTRFPNMPEKERKIIGFYKIENIENKTEVIGKKNFGLRLTLEEASELNFWSYHKNKNSSDPNWKQGRFRYLEDDQIAAILHDLKDIVRDPSDKEMIIKLLNEDYTKYSLSKPKVKGAIEDNNKLKIELKRKYGKGGESKLHKDLKNFIANNPQKIGLKKSETIPVIEHGYLSGDRVDILFKPKSTGTNTIVEIELNDIMPGIHQAIKYRALRCSQLGLELTNKQVKATIVAWKFTDEEKQLCKKYSIDYFQIKL